MDKSYIACCEKPASKGDTLSWKREGFSFLGILLGVCFNNLHLLVA